MVGPVCGTKRTGGQTEPKNKVLQSILDRQTVVGHHPIPFERTPQVGQPTSGQVGLARLLLVLVTWTDRYDRLVSKSSFNVW